MRKRILIVVAAPMTVRAFLLKYIQALALNFDVTVVCASEDSNLAAELPTGVSLVHIDIRRNIAPVADLKALFALVRLMRAGRFAMVHSVTPKAGLLGQMAARWSGVDVRVHTFTGQVWVTKAGAVRWLLKHLDWLIGKAASQLLADSASQREFLIAQGVVDARKIAVLGAGSISGVDTVRFQPAASVRAAVRQRLGCTERDVIALFIGRLKRDKGVLDLVRAFARVTQRLPALVLCLVGPDEEEMTPDILAISENNPRLRVLGSSPRPEDFMAAADFFCMPSYREGFGTVVIEAAACGVPAMASAIYGLIDAVEDGRSGVLHPPRDVDAIAHLLERFTVEKTWRESLGQQAQARVQSDFSAEAVLAVQMAFVEHLLGPSSQVGDSR